MQQNIFVISVVALVVNLLHAADFSVAFKPDKLSWKECKIEYSYQYQKCLEYFYDGDDNVVFYILSKYRACMNCLLAKAKNCEGNLVLKNPGHILYTDIASILQNFYVENGTESSEISHAVIDPESLLLEQKQEHGTNTYYVSFTGTKDETKKEIPVHIFNALNRAKDLAPIENALVKINVHEFMKNSPCAENCVAIVRKNSKVTKCRYCEKKL